MDVVVVYSLSTSVDTQCIQTHHLYRPAPRLHLLSMSGVILSEPKDTPRVDATVQTSPPASLASLRHTAELGVSGTTPTHAAVPCHVSLAGRLHLLAIPREICQYFLLHVQLWYLLLLSDTYTCMDHGLVQHSFLAAVAIPSGLYRHACTTMCIANALYPAKRSLPACQGFNYFLCYCIHMSLSP